MAKALKPLKDLLGNVLVEGDKVVTIRVNTRAKGGGLIIKTLAVVNDAWKLVDEKGEVCCWCYTRLSPEKLLKLHAEPN